MPRTVYLHEFTVTKPDLIRFEIRDGDLLKGGVVEAENPPLSGSSGTWYQDSGGYYLIVGKDKTHKRYEDVPPLSFLDRAAADDETNWAITGGIGIDAVHRWTSPQDNGHWAGDTNDGVGIKITVMRHYLWLELDADLVNGTEYTVTFPTEFALVDYVFTYRDKATRCSAIAVDQIGYGEQDEAKIAYLSEWVPGYGTRGAVSFSGVTDWHVMDRNGTIVWSAGAAPVSRLGPTDSELTRIGMNTYDRRLIDTTVAPRTITGYTNANPVVVTFTGADLVNDTIIRVEDVRADTNAGAGVTDELSSLNSNINFAANTTATQPGYNWVVKNVNNSGPKTFELYKDGGTTGYNRSGSTATWLSGGTIYETFSLDNRYATNVYELDFSAFTPSAPGIFYIYVEGIGISHPFHIDNGTWHKKANIFAAGEYHFRHDCAADGRFGYTMPAGFTTDGVYNTVYNSLVPHMFTDEWGGQGISSTDPLGGFVATSYSTTPFITRNGTGAETADFVIGHHDAGDPDSRLTVHYKMYYGLIDIYDNNKAAAETMNFNIPTVEELHPADTTYAGTSVLPDAMQQSLWSLRSYLQGVDELGQARGGTNYGQPSEIVPTFLSQSPHPTSSSVIYNYAPDHGCGHLLASLCAKMAVALRKHGSFETLAQYFEDKAILIWDRAELVFDGGSLWGAHSSGAVETARLTMYGDYQTACNTVTNTSYILPYDGASGTFTGTLTGGTSGATATIYSSSNVGGLYIYNITNGPFQDNETITATGGGTALVNNPGNPALKTPFESRFNTIQSQSSSATGKWLFRKIACEMAMYRMTGDDTYNDNIVAYWNGLSAGDKTSVFPTTIFPCGAWEYINADHPNADATIQADFASRMKSRATSQVVAANGSGVGFRAFKEASSGASFGADGTNWSNIDHLIRCAYAIAESESAGTGVDYKKQIIYGFNYIFGCNLLKRSFVYDAGIDPPGTALHNEAMSMGVNLPRGSCLLGNAPRQYIGSLIFESNNNLNWVTKNNSATFTENYNLQKAVYPSVDSWPSAAHFVNVYGAIEMSENIIAGTLGPQAWLGAVMYAANGNGQTTLSTDVPAGKTRATARTIGTKLYIQSLTENGPYKVIGSIGCDTDDTTVYWVATTSATKPTSAQVVAGQDHTGTAAISSGNFTMDNQYGYEYEFTGLDPDTLHYFHLVAKDASNVYAPAVTDSATTLVLVPFAVDYRGGAVSTTDASTYTWDNSGSHYSIGTANSQRQVVVATTARWGTQTNITPTSVTIKPTGQSDVVADLIAGENFTGSAVGHNFVGIYDDLATLGTTADVEVVWNQTSLRSSVDIWTVSGAQPVVADSASVSFGSGTNPSATVTIPTGGVAICIAYGVGGTTSGVVWTANGSSSGVSEDSDDLVEGTAIRRSTARITTTGSVTILATFTGGTTDSGLAIVVYEPY